MAGVGGPAALTMKRGGGEGGDDEEQREGNAGKEKHTEDFARE